MPSVDLISAVSFAAVYFARPIRIRTPGLSRGIDSPRNVTTPFRSARTSPRRTPDYLKIVEVFREDRPAEAYGQIGGPFRLVIETSNVKRLQLDRRKLPWPADQSIAVYFDEQVIGWTPQSEVVELERSRNGAWAAAKRPLP